MYYYLIYSAGLFKPFENKPFTYEWIIIDTYGWSAYYVTFTRINSFNCQNHLNKGISLYSPFYDEETEALRG